MHNITVTVSTSTLTTDVILKKYDTNVLSSISVYRVGVTSLKFRLSLILFWGRNNPNLSAIWGHLKIRENSSI